MVNVSSGLIPSGLTLRVMWPRRESNPDLAFRKRLFYPLNYSAKSFLKFFELWYLYLFWSIPIIMPHQVISL